MKKSRIIKTLFRAFFIICTLGFLWSCEEDEDTTPPNNRMEDVYVAGTAKSDHYGRATYWKNGIPVTLNTEARGSNANDIFIKGSDIYVVGSKLNDEYEDIPVLWVNGRESLLNIVGRRGAANSIFVTDRIYIGGYDSNINYPSAKLWVSGLGLDVRSLNGGSSEIKSVFVDQGMVYLAGYEYEGDYKVAKYWTYAMERPLHFEEFTLDQVSNEVNGNIANSIVVKNNNIYIAGHNGKNATLWKNNDPTNIYPTEFNFEGYSISIKENDVYVLGSGGDITTNLSWYWKNGEITNLSRGDADLEFASSIAVGEDNIYVAGYFRKAQEDWAVLWTNNHPVDLTQNKTRSWTRSVKVVPK